MLMKVIFFMVVAVSRMHCHSTGAISAACSNLLPGHRVSAQTSPAPYRIVVPQQVEHGQTVNVTIENGEPDFMPFRGFIIQARAVETQAVVGRFLITGDMKTVDCPSLPVDSVATHSNPSDKSSLVLQWVAPEDFSGLVVFQ